MPNWCENRLKVLGPASDVARLREKARAVEEQVDDEGRLRQLVSVLSLQELYPCPAPLLDTAAGPDSRAVEVVFGSWTRHVPVGNTTINTRQELIDFIEENNKGFTAYAHRCKKNIDEHGHPTWYTWKISHWGTKWDLCNPQEIGHSTETSKELSYIHEGKEAQADVEYSFETAWAPPSSAFEKISKDFPTLVFELDFYEPGMEFGGSTRFEAGESEGGSEELGELPAGSWARERWEDDKRAWAEEEALYEAEREE